MKPAHPATVLVASREGRTAERIAGWLRGGPTPSEVQHAASLGRARRLVDRLQPAVIYFDEGVLAGVAVRTAARELTQFAPVVAAVSAESARELAVTVAAGAVDCVPEDPEFLELAAALIERRLLSARRMQEQIE